MNPMETLKDLLKAYGKTDPTKYINPQANQLLQALLGDGENPGNPEIVQVVGKYLQDKKQMMDQAGVKPKEGQANG
jgi:hypothetical protein